MFLAVQLINNIVYSMSNLTKIMNQALGSTTLKRIRFKRDPGNLESTESYEGYILEEDDVSGSVTIFVPELQDGLMNVDPESIEMFTPPIESNICKLKASAAKHLIEIGAIDCELELQKLDSIQTIEQLEFYLNQFDLCDTQMLNIYRFSFHA